MLRTKVRQVNNILASTINSTITIYIFILFFSFSCVTFSPLVSLPLSCHYSQIQSMFASQEWEREGSKYFSFPQFTCLLIKSRTVIQWVSRYKGNEKRKFQSQLPPWQLFLDKLVRILFLSLVNTRFFPIPLLNRQINA